MAAPSRKDRTRPAELLALAGGLAIFVGLIVLLATRALLQAVVSLGVVFIVALVVLAMLSLVARPSTDDLDKDPKDSTGSGE
jgi:hypothetical protein